MNYMISLREANNHPHGQDSISSTCSNCTAAAAGSPRCPLKGEPLKADNKPYVLLSLTELWCLKVLLG